ncbi:MAG: AAA family ATPase [Oscillospiraceae bacterium]|nr:AAA family ATPase [Oscillospiraceae bacterium]
MAELISTVEAAALWNLSPRRVAILCKEGRIPGAVLEGRRWLIPADAQKPSDHRLKTAENTKTHKPKLLPLPVGISDFKRASTQYYYVDKTLLIRDFLDELPVVSLFTRPRRFGKTLNMDMLRTFFEKTDEDTSVYFRNKNIWKCGQRYRNYQGKYPVIYITFKDTKLSNWADTLAGIRFLFTNEFQRHGELADSPECTGSDKDYYRKIVSGTAGEAELMNALLVLSKMLHAHHGIAPIIIIDEYDTPIQQGHMLGFYDEVIRFMRNLFSGGFKDNPHLSYGFLTGILRVAKESIFSGLNNLKINSILDEQYSEYFGFTAQEVRQMAEDYHVPEKYAEICDWYDGYRFGSSDIFNPWSVINYFGHVCKPRAYWVSTSSNDIIGEIMTGATAELYEKLNSLLQGNTVLTYIDTDVVYPRIRENPSSVYSFLLVTGYLKLVTAELSMGDGYMCEVALPNKEIAYVYKKEILEKLDGLIPQSTAISIQEALYTGNADDLQKQLETLLLQSASYYDTAGEMFYHGLMLGLTAMMDDRYLVASNRESGEGRYDLALEPKGTALPGILIELKAERNASAEELKSLAKAALEQIDKRKYDAGLKAKGVKKVLKYGVAFSGKSVEIMVG